MLSGRRLDLADPSPLDVEIEDIAHGLARVARWNGQTLGDHIFSVAQHSLLVEALTGYLDAEASVPTRIMALLHDAPEYVVGDIISPFKAIIGEPYKDIEGRLLHAIHIRFGLPPSPDAATLKLIKQADKQAAYLEAVRLAGFEQTEAVKYFGKPVPMSRALEVYLSPWTIREAQERFIERFSELGSRHAASP